MTINENKIQEFIDKGQQIIDYAVTKNSSIPGIPFHSWQTQVVAYLKNNLLESNHYLIAFQEKTATSTEVSSYVTALVAGMGILKSLKEDIESGAMQELGKSSGPAPVDNLNIILNNFHKVVKQLEHRHSDRPTLKITDEYDVQDLLHSLLKLYFDDIRPEEWAPSYAGGSPRMDFLIKEHKIVIEIKKTRANLRDKEIGQELIIDIAKYKNHPDCETLICFVYDPEGLIRNPKALENDLNQKEKPFVNVIIRPQH